MCIGHSVQSGNLLMADQQAPRTTAPNSPSLPRTPQERWMSCEAVTRWLMHRMGSETAACCDQVYETGVSHKLRTRGPGGRSGRREASPPDDDCRQQTRLQPCREYAYMSQQSRQRLVDDSTCLSSPRRTALENTTTSYSGGFRRQMRMTC
jgi:hypothetical protein